jgi:uncharacterized protein (DUF2267 family)
MNPKNFFNGTLEKTADWINDVNRELGWEDPRKAYQALRLTLHTLRDRMTLEEVAQFSAQLPMLVRGFYYEGWAPAGKPLKQRHKDEFLEPIFNYFMDDADVDVEQVARAVFQVIARRISKGEIEDILHLMPKELRELWAEAA